MHHDSSPGHRTLFLGVVALVLLASLVALALYQRMTLERKLLEIVDDAGKATRPGAEPQVAIDEKLLAGALQPGIENLTGKLQEISTLLGEIKRQSDAAGQETRKQLEGVLSLGKERSGKEQSRIDERFATLAKRISELEEALEQKDEALARAMAERARAAEENERDLAFLRNKLELERQHTTRLESSLEVEERPPPATPLESTVEAVEESSGVVVLDAGQEQGLAAGHVLFVTRDGERIGRVKVLKVQPKLSGATILETEPGQGIQIGDKASTGAPEEAAPIELPPLGRKPAPPPAPKSGPM